MTPFSFFSQARVFVVTGKGGTGKTTLCGVMANLAARAGLRALVVQVATGSARSEPGTAHLSRLFGREEVLDYDEVALRDVGEGGEVRARALRPDTALSEYLHLHGMRRLSRRLVSTGALEVVATAVPGMPDMLVLGKVKQMERAAAAGQPGAPDVIFLDAPAAGHAVRFLQSPHGLLEAAAAGPVHSQAEEVVAMLSDPARCRVVLVTTPEETPVSETLETAQLLEDRAGTNVCAVVVNGRLPVLSMAVLEAAADLDPAPRAAPRTSAKHPAPSRASAHPRLSSAAEEAGVHLSGGELEDLLAAGRLRTERQASQAAQVARLASELPVRQLELPFCFSAELGPDELGTLTDALGEAVADWEPDGLS